MTKPNKALHSTVGLILFLFAAFTATVFAQQPTASDGKTAASQQTYELKIEFNRRVRMRDGTELSADVYRPKAPGRFPVILNRTPYTKTGGNLLSLAQYFVPHGYVVIAMDVRGRGDSDGRFEPYRNDGQDGYDVIEWCAAQEW